MGKGAGINPRGVGWGQHRPHVYTPEEIFTAISTAITGWQKKLYEPVLKIQTVTTAVAELKGYSVKLNAQPGNTDKLKKIKNVLVWKLSRLQSYALLLKKEIDAMQASNKKIANTEQKEVANAKKLLPQKNEFLYKMPNQVVKKHLFPYLTTQDKAKISLVCKFWKEKCYQETIQESLVLLSAADQLVMPTSGYQAVPTLGMLNQAIQIALKQASFSFWKITQLSLVPHYLSEQMKKDDKQVAVGTVIASKK